MNIVSTLVTFTLVAGIMTITPGLDTALVLRTSIVEGAPRGIRAGLGIAAGVLTWGLIVSIGLGALLLASQVAYKCIRIAGAGYLIFMGCEMLLRSMRGKGYDAGPALPSSSTSRTQSWFLRGMMTNIFNPKVGAFYVTFFPQFIPAHVNVTLFSMMLAAIHAGEAVVWFTALSIATRGLAQVLAKPRVKRGLDAITGALLLGFGGLLLLERR